MLKKLLRLNTKLIIAMVMIVSLLLINCNLVFAANSTTLTNNNHKSISTIKPLDPAKVAPIDPTKFPNNPKGDINIPETGSSSNNNVATTSGVSIAASYQIRANENTIWVDFNSSSGNITPFMSFGATLNVFDVNGNCTYSTAISDTWFYNNTWTIYRSMSSVEETIVLTNITAVKDFQTGYGNDISLIRTNQKGGSYSSITSAMGGQRHHCFAVDTYNYTTVNKYDSSHNVIGTVTKNGSAPVILMTTADHQKTSSWGSSTTAVNYRNAQLALVKQGKYLAAMNMDIDDIHNKIGHKYDGAISQMWIYATTTLGWYQ